MPDCWLEVSIRNVLRTATSTQIFIGFPVSVYKQRLRWFPRFQVATTCFSCSPPDLNLLVTNFIFCIHVKWPLPPSDNSIAVNNNNNNFKIVALCNYVLLPATVKVSKLFREAISQSLKKNKKCLNVMTTLLHINGRKWYKPTSESLIYPAEYVYIKIV